MSIRINSVLAQICTPVTHDRTRLDVCPLCVLPLTKKRFHPLSVEPVAVLSVGWADLPQGVMAAPLLVAVVPRLEEPVELPRARAELPPEDYQPSANKLVLPFVLYSPLAY